MTNLRKLIESKLDNDYLVVDLETAGCNLYDTKLQAQKSRQGNCIVVPCKKVNKEEAELILYHNADNPQFLYSAEFKHDLISDDLRQATEDNPIKIYVM